MRSRHGLSRAGFGWFGALALVLAAWTFARPSPAVASPVGPAPQAGAQREFQRARREQALIRAENTALLLHVLAAAPTLPGGDS